MREPENEYGCFFDRNADGTVHQKAFAGQCVDRTIHHGDLTGIEIISRPAEQTWASGVERLEEHRAVALIPNQAGDGLREHTRMTGTALEEGLRGAGGYLFNGDCERYMECYDERGEQATRNVISRGIFSEIQAGRATFSGGAYIYMAHLESDTVRRQFRGMIKRCAVCGFDLAGDRMEAPIAIA